MGHSKSITLSRIAKIMNKEKTLEYASEEIEKMCRDLFHSLETRISQSDIQEFEIQVAIGTLSMTLLWLIRKRISHEHKLDVIQNLNEYLLLRVF